MRNRNWVIATMIVAAVGLGYVLMTRGPWAKATADDSYRTTSLSMTNIDIDGDGNTEAAVVANLSTTLATDAHVRIDTYWRRPNQSENQGSSAYADRENSNTLWVQFMQPQSEFYSGDVIRVVFTCSDSNGQTFTYERTATFP